jgi:beta-N-acetylhexosaminidase
MSDDLSMKALGGAFDARARRCRAAGCDLALHCNGDMAEMEAVAEGAGALEGASRARYEAALKWRRPPAPFDAAAAAERLAGLLAPIA